MKVFILIVLAFFFISCSSDREEKFDGGEGVSLPGATNEVGDISSGGGGTLPDNPVSATYIFNIIVESKRDLRVIVNSEHELFYNSSRETALYTKLFGGKINLIDVLESVDIEILMDKPCKDSVGKAVDGSVYASIPNAICISPYSMAPKLIEERARVEVLALIVHELSHLLGTTEEEAVDLQKSVALQIKGIDETSSLYWVDEQAVRASNVSRHLGRIIRNFENLSFDEMGEFMSKASLQNRFNFRPPEHFISLLNGKEKDLNKFFDLGMFRLLNWHITSKSNHHLSEKSRKLYEEAFKGKSQIRYKDYAAVHADFDLDNFYGESVLKRINDKTDLLEQLSRLEQYYDELSEYFYKIKFNQKLSSVNSPLSENVENPWSAFKGEYEVTQTTCVENGLEAVFNETGFVVKTREDGKLTLVVKNKNGFGEMGLFNDAGDFWGGSTVRVYQSGLKVFRSAEYGTLWNKEWRHKHYSLEQTSPVLYQMMKRTSVKKRRSDYVLKESSFECTYDLEIKS